MVSGYKASLRRIIRTNVLQLFGFVKVFFVNCVMCSSQALSERLRKLKNIQGRA